jgi:S-adenosylmethionine synthetase
MLFTSESVTSGHPDKVCDQISDAVLDACLAIDPTSKVALETWVKGNTIGLIGELTTKANPNFEQIIRKTLTNIGYNREELGFDGNTCEIYTQVSQQSPEINHAVVKSDEEVGAGDQGMMFGLATNQTPELMPLPIHLAHRLAEKLEKYRKKLEKKKDFSLRPDGKTQVTIEYDKKNKNKPIFIDTILISTQHSDKISQPDLKKLLVKNVILPVIAQEKLEKLFDEKKTKILVNPSGSFVVGGPIADSGVTGRKIIVDSYGGWARVGGGAFSGKDATKVDRSAAYMTRFLAKQIVAQGLANEVEIQVSYAIGQPEPVSVSFYGDLLKSEKEIFAWLNQNFDLRPAKIIAQLKLNKPIYLPTASYGHFGRKAKGDLFPWEKII